MIIQVRCDNCGKIGDASEILSDYDGSDLCIACGDKTELQKLEADYLARKQWLEETHLRDLRIMAAAIVSKGGRVPDSVASKDSNANWENNHIQFPRLLEEAQMAGAFTPEIMNLIATSMDMDCSQVEELLERARAEWDSILRNL